LARLHNAGCARDKGRQSHPAFRPIRRADPPRPLQPRRTLAPRPEPSKPTQKVQNNLGVRYASLGSLSEAARVFDPDLLVPIINELAGELRPRTTDPRLRDLRHIVTAVDSTLVKTLPCLAEAMYSRTKDNQKRFYWRLHTHFEIDRHLPVRIDATDPASRDHSNEKDVLRRHLQADHCYVMDRGFAQFRLFNDIADAQSSYVCRIQDKSNLEIVQDQPLSEAARAAGVVQDAVVRLGLGSKAPLRPHHPCSPGGGRGAAARETRRSQRQDGGTAKQRAAVGC
jgi:hypothetical protein